MLRQIQLGISRVKCVGGVVEGLTVKLANCEQYLVGVCYVTQRPEPISLPNRSFLHSAAGARRRDLPAHSSDLLLLFSICFHRLPG